MITAPRPQARLFRAEYGIQDAVDVGRDGLCLLEREGGRRDWG